MNIEKIRSSFEDVNGKADLLAKEWEGKEDEMPMEVLQDIKALVAESTDLFEKLQTAKELAGQTEFLKKGLKCGAKIFNGYAMLEMQAEKAWEIWNE